MRLGRIAAPLALLATPLAAQTSGDTAPASYPVEEKSIGDLDAAMASGEASSAAITQAYIDRIAALDDRGPQLNAVIALLPGAMAEARLRDAERAAGRVRGPMHGIPVIVKDNIETTGPVPTTAGSFALENNVTDRDAPLVARLRAAGAVILGKANLSEWANFRSNDSTSGWSAVGGLTRNPYALDRNSCGSSSGSAVAAAASLAAGAVGTETDGSITCPASSNGVVGFKPTVGLVSRRFVVPISHSQDTAGPMTRSVRDAAIMLGAMAGVDPGDPATAAAQGRVSDYAGLLGRDVLNGLQIGVPRDRLGDDEALIAQFEQALDVLRAQGATIVDIADSRSGLDGLGDAEFQVLLSEFKADIADYLQGLPDGVKNGGVEARNLADLMAFNMADKDRELQYFDQSLFVAAQAQEGLDDPAYIAARDKAKRLAGPMGIDRMLAEHRVTILALPTRSPVWLSTLGEGDAFTGPSASGLPAQAGYPHLTVPMGLIGGLPVGISFIGSAWTDDFLLQVGDAYERAADARVPPQYLASVGAGAEQVRP
ncbi:amidase [Novosphingopyxis baekryungensis]|uniref:amidase n=1 Tax=Novosphingopyxis baekryungensis TaxID=279369 RepID=UPI0003B66037|nr:amidase [Novosphingopyxis baekryungensis]